MIYINHFFLNIFKQFRRVYLNTNFYDKKISNIDFKDFVYKPSPHLLSSLINYQKKKYRIEDFTLEDVWNKKTISAREYERLNNFYWFFSLDLKSSKQTTQNVVSNWINNNHKYNYKSWNLI